MTNEHWTRDFEQRAQKWWTPERTRQLIGLRRPLLLPGEAPLLLRALGLLNGDASMPPANVRKYRQINHMLAVLQPTLRILRDRYETVRLLDAASGRSYLSTLLAWVFRHRWNHPIQILGVDRGGPLVDESRRRTERLGLNDVLKFEESTLADFDPRAAWPRHFDTAPQSPDATPFHGLVSLHACNTATDDAIALGIRYRAPVIAVVPCCQSELSTRWAALSDQNAPGAFEPLWGAPHLRHVTAAHITDLMRVLLLRAAGWDTSAIEFVPLEHTPKNTLIRAEHVSDGDEAARNQYLALRDAMGGAGISLEEHVLG